MALVELAAQLRTETGKGAAHRVRQAGMLPGIVYGPGEASVKIAVEMRVFERVLRQAAGGTMLIDLKVDGDSRASRKVLMKEVQRDPVTSRPLHIDLLHVSMSKPVHVVVPIQLEGIPVGVKTEGGFVDHVLRELEVECLPGDIPEYISVDVTPLEIGESVHAGDITHETVQILTPPDRVVVAVHGRAAPTPVEEAAAAEAEESKAAAEAEAEEGAEESPAEGDPKGGKEKKKKK